MTLAGDEIHLWRASLDQAAVSMPSLAQTLAEDEQARAKRFYFERDRRRFIAGRGMLRMILGRYLDLKPAQVSFHYGAYGKPALSETIGPERLFFNLAHSQELALYAVSRAAEMGIDLEYIHPLAELEQIAVQFFSAHENGVLQSLPDNQKLEAFFNCWTRKEAYLKATGDGLAQPLAGFDVSFIPGEPARLLNLAGQPQAANRWFMHALTPAPGYVAALVLPAHAGSGWRIKYWQFSVEPL